MRTLVIVIASVVLAATQSLHASLLSGPTINPLNGHLYYLLNFDTWTDSQAQAVVLGGNLVTINDSSEENWVYNTFSKFGGVNRNLWTGMTSVTSTGSIGSWHWISGEPVSYTNWGDGEPNNFGGTEHWGIIMCPGGARPALATQWADIQDDGYGGGGEGLSWAPNAVVEVVPEPATTTLLALAVIAICWRRCQ